MKRLLATGLYFLPLIFILALPASALDYVQSSQGLTPPQWEGGRTEVEMADLNLDGKIDLISIGDHGNPFINTQEHGFMWYAGDGHGNWTVTQTGNFGYGGVAVGDANNDGFPDLGYGMHHNYSSNDLGDQFIEVALGDGSGVNWTPWDDNLATAGETYGMFATDFGDVDNDGLLDIAATSFGYGNPLHVYLNNGDGTWTHATTVSSGNCGMHVVFGDINKDGNLDLATAYQNGTVFFGMGNGQFYSADYNLPPGSGSYNRNGVALGDVDNDGGMDLAWVSSSGIHVWAFNESTTSWVDFTGNLPQSGVSGYAQLWDMNGDGFCDVAVGGSGHVTVWTGNGQGTWTQAATFTNPAASASFNAFRVGGDVDLNGYPDIVYVADEGNLNSLNVLRCWRETTRPVDLTIMPLFPRGGEVFKVGSARFTDWLSAVPGAAISRVKVELSTAGPAGPWTVLADSLPNNGRLQWTVSPANSANCRLRYTVTAGANSVTSITPASFIITNGIPNLDVTLSPINPPIVVPAQGGQFSFNISAANGGPAMPYVVWARIKNPDGSYTAPTLGPVTINTPVGVTVTRARNQTVPGTWTTGLYTYLGYVNTAYAYPALDSSSFTWTKSATSNGGPMVWEAICSGDLFPGEIGGRRSIASDFTGVSAFPNPFNPSTTITFTLPEASHVTLDVYDVSGRHIVQLVNGQCDLGTHQANFDGLDLCSGLYLYRLTTSRQILNGKMLLLK